MNGKACYVEIDSYAATWLRNLISRGVIAGGDVLNCSVVDIRPVDLAGYSQVHLYAGIGVWSYSLRRAGIPDSANVWTFSEPCQPFSAAGKRRGFTDERYLRPYTHHLVEQCRPAICLGEQVASNDGLGWLDVVQSDMERARYVGGALDTCSAGFGAPHIRQRLRLCYASEEWLAHAASSGWRSERPNSDASDCLEAFRGGQEESGRRSSTRVVADTHDARSQGSYGMPECSVKCAVGSVSVAGELADADSQSRRLSAHAGRTTGFEASRCREVGRAGPTNGFWTNADWLFCRDGKWRPVEPGTFPLAHGASSRVGRDGTSETPSRIGMLRAYGNAVDAEATTDFCRNVGEVLGLI